MKTSTFTASIAALLLATGTAHAVEIPKQYRGEWCNTKWKTIYKRCRSANAFSVLRDAWGVDDEGCTLMAIHKSKYGGHRLLGRCSSDAPEGVIEERTEERWWLGSNNTRLQVIIEKHEDKK
jgi:hypothetical protein